ncbi:MAG: ABC transporter, partial [Gammaproteobacteria bacterium]
ITRELNIMTLFPRAAALELNDSGDWNGRPLLTTLARAWTETGELVDEISYNEGSEERAGPLDIGIVLFRNREQENGDDSSEPVEQRIVVLGDGDFISNTYAGNGGNVELGLNIIHWLSHDDAFIAIRPKAAPDQILTLSNTAQIVIGIGFLFVLPLLLLFTGLIIWLRRRKR